jgi:peroxiredoxin
MNRKFIFLWTASLTLILLGIGFKVLARDGNGLQFWDDDAQPIAQNAWDAQPLSVGDRAPFGTLRTMDGKAVDFETLIHQKPTILIFYQGGWSPYSNAQMDQWVKIEPRLVELGYQVAAITPDQPSKLAESAAKHNINYLLLSDRLMDVTRRFGLAYRVDKSVFEKAGVRLEEYTGNSLHLLPMPATYGIDKKGVIRFVYFDPDYYGFLSNPEKILRAAKRSLSDEP